MKLKISGNWIYRSTKNEPTIVDDFNKVKFGEGKLELNEYAPGLISGTFDFGEDVKLIVIGYIEGNHIRLRSVGIKGTPTEGWIYEHMGSLAPEWPNGDEQRPAIVGSVIRSASHNGQPAGFVGSFVAVSVDAVVGTGIDPLPDAVKATLGMKGMRLHHTAWHATRNAWGRLNDATRKAIGELDWTPPRPSLEYTGWGERKRTITWSGAGEDFLFMHRQMIATFLKAMSNAGVNDWRPWTTVPSPHSGPTVPPAWDDGDPEDSARFAALKTDTFYWSRMRWWDERFKDPVYLRTISLGELGAQMEWSIHNDMHMRWSGLPRDPVTNEPNPGGRASDNFDPKWSLPNYDDLADFYSSHVNPIFYKLHGWIDDRINDWFDAHEQAEKGSVELMTVMGTPWFKKGKWVQVEMPWIGPMGGHMGGGDMDEDAMMKVIHLVEHPLGVTLRAMLRQQNVARVSSW
jgi:hypothetical protein